MLIATREYGFKSEQTVHTCSNNSLKRTMLYLMNFNGVDVDAVGKHLDNVTTVLKPLVAKKVPQKP